MPIRRSVLMIRTAISPRLAISTVSNTRAPFLHPENAVGHRRKRRPAAGGQGQAERGAGLHRVDDAVVPEPGGGVVRVSLLFVLGPDRGLERLFVLLAPVVTELVPPDRGQHRRGLLAAHDRYPRARPDPQEAR